MVLSKVHQANIRLTVITSKAILLCHPKDSIHQLKVIKDIGHQPDRCHRLDLKVLLRKVHMVTVAISLRSNCVATLNSIASLHEL